MESAKKATGSEGERKVYFYPENEGGLWSKVIIEDIVWDYPKNEIEYLEVQFQYGKKPHLIISSKDQGPIRNHGKKIGPKMNVLSIS